MIFCQCDLFWGGFFRGGEVVLYSFPRSLTSISEADELLLPVDCDLHILRCDYLSCFGLAFTWKVCSSNAGKPHVLCTSMAWDMAGGGYIVTGPGSFTQHTKRSPYNFWTRLSHTVGEMVNSCMWRAGRNMQWEAQSTGSTSNPEEATTWQTGGWR